MKERAGQVVCPALSFFSSEGLSRQWPKPTPPPGLGKMASLSRHGRGNAVALGGCCRSSLQVLPAPPRRRGKGEGEGEDPAAIFRHPALQAGQTPDRAIRPLFGRLAPVLARYMSSSSS